MVNKMWTLSWLYGSLSIIAIVSGVDGTYNFTEPNRQTHIYGRDFFVAIPLRGSEPETGSFLQIACVSSGSSSQATGNITLFGESNSKSFTAGPTNSYSLGSLVTFPQNKDTAVLNIQSDLDIIVTVFIKISGTLSAYTAIPSTSLDKVYLVASYGLQEDNLSELTVVATSPEGTTCDFLDNAENFTIPIHQGNHSGLSFNLGRGESVTYQTVNDFTGGHLQCSEPVVGVVESRCLSQGHGCAGHSVEQLFPLVALGTRYTAVPVDSDGLSDIFRAVAVWDNTEILWHSRDSQSGNLTLNNSQTKDLSFKVHEAATIIGSKPFLLLHHVEKGNPINDIALVSVPPHEQLTRKAITFSTYMYMYPKMSPETGYPESYITIINPCKYGTLLQHVPSRLHTNSPLHSPLIQRDGEMCGSSRRLDAGVYTLEPSTDDANASYSAILYTVTKSGVAAHILATELNQVVCSVEPKPSEEVHLCPVMVAPSKSPTISSSTSQPTTISTEIKNNASGTILAIIIAVVSLLAGGTVISILLFRYCKGRKWRRLDESDYMEDNPIRMQVIE